MPHLSLPLPNRWRLAAPLVALLFFGSAAAKADGGEVTLSATADQEWAYLPHPMDGRPFRSRTGTYVPRFGGLVEYGVSNRLRLGVAVRVALSRNVRFPVSSSKDPTYVGGELVAKTRDILATAVLTAILLDGDAWFGELALEAGAQSRRWQLTHRIKGGEASAPIEASQKASWSVAPYLRAGPHITWRPFQYISLTLSPYVSLELPNTLALGGSVGIGVPLGAGPNF